MRMAFMLKCLNQQQALISEAFFVVGSVHTVKSELSGFFSVAVCPSERTPGGLAGPH